MEKYVRALIESYPNLGPMTPSSWVLRSDEPPISTDIQLGLVCHANLKYNHYNKWTKLLLPVTGLHAVEYITQLINGPFVHYKDQITINQLEDDHYLVVTGLNKFPANAMYNFCIASRGPIEFPDTVQNWLHLKRLGVPADLALIIAGLTDYGLAPANLDGKLAYVGVSNTNHWWFNIGSDWNLILSGNPIELSCAYNQDRKACTPTNIIWGKDDPHRTFSLFEKNTLREIMDKYK